MATISENLQTIVDSTSAIKQAIINKGGIIEGDISTWASAINALQTDGSTSDEEITFVGTLTWDFMDCTITGNLSSKPKDATFASLVIAFRNGVNAVMESASIDNTSNISITCNYGEPVMDGMVIIPAIYILYVSANSFETKIVPVKFESA